MIVASVRLWAYALPLARPLAARGAAAEHREGFVLELTDAEGRTAFGEAAPLPAHGSETATAALAALRRLQPGPLPDGADRLDDALAAWHAPLGLGPAAACAVETAVLGLTAARRGLPLHRLIEPAAPDSVAVAGLIDAGGDAGAEAARLVALGHRTLKLKVGGGPLAHDLARVRAAAAALPAGGALRLDANRAWGDGAAAALAALAASGAPIAFVEEPGGPGDALPRALDETLVGLRPDAACAALAAPGVAAVVLKPMLLGYAAAAALARAARARGLAVAISASFESTLGLRAAAALAAALGTADAGLGTAGWLSADLVPPEPEPAVIDLARAAPIDRRRLVPVDG